MPTYGYLCEACGRAHEEFKSMSAPHPAACPSCGEPHGERFRQDFRGSAPLGIVKGNPTTIGQQAELNARRAGKEQMRQMAEEDRARVRGFTGRLPKGARPNTTGTGERPWFRDGIAGNVLDKPLDLRKVKDAKKYIETGETS